MTGEFNLPEAEYRGALARGRRRKAAEWRAVSARYRPTPDEIELTFPSGAMVRFKRTLVPELRALAPEDVAELALSPAGFALEIERRDLHLSLSGLLEGLLGDRHGSTTDDPPARALG